MKRTLSVILIVTMLLAVFASCGGNVVDSTTQESTLQTTEITTVETTEATTDVTTEQTTEATTTNKPIVEKPKTIYDMVARQYTYHNDFLNKDLTYNYRVFYPSGYSEENADTYPMLFFLHGHGEVGTDNFKQLQVVGGANLLLDEVIARNDCIVVAPQSPHAPVKSKELQGYYSMEWVSINEDWKTGSRAELPELAAAGMYAAIGILNSFLDSGKVDLNRVYISGISMGGYGTWEMITRLPDVFAAAIPLCGAGFPSYAESLKDIAIWAFHGEADATVPVSGTRDMEKALKEVGGNMKATYFPGVKHEVWDHAYSEPGLVDWLFAQSKNK